MLTISEKLLIEYCQSQNRGNMSIGAMLGGIIFSDLSYDSQALYSFMEKINSLFGDKIFQNEKHAFNS